MPLTNYLNYVYFLAGETGAHERDRTADLVLTKDVLYQLSYVGSDARRTLRQEDTWSG